ncbi:MAG: chemotaxis protein CheW [Deltaproteobacteria bacterium]|nr:chemotaxis protein CheW [Deltaproteobacteria bacterium]
MAVSEISETRQYLTFKLEDEIFAIDVAKVQEVLDYMNITVVPKSPDYMRGVINVRGSVVPVADLRLKFGMTRTEKAVDTCIIATEIVMDEETTVIGALADSVQEVVDIGPEQIEPAPKIGSRWRPEFIRGIGKHNDRFIIILEIDRIFSAEELERVQGGNFEEAIAANVKEEPVH